MQYEIEKNLKGRGKVFITGESEVEPFCDCYCDDKTHPHVIEHNYEVVTEGGLEVMMDDQLRAQIDTIVENYIYEAYRGVREDSREYA
jgi:hypothetical protein